MRFSDKYGRFCFWYCSFFAGKYDSAKVLFRYFFGQGYTNNSLSVFNVSDFSQTSQPKNSSIITDTCRYVSIRFIRCAALCFLAHSVACGP